MAGFEVSARLFHETFRVYICSSCLSGVPDKFLKRKIRELVSYALSVCEIWVGCGILLEKFLSGSNEILIACFTGEYEDYTWKILHTIIIS